ncbi:MAG TPA: RNA polymerase subunit sigma-24, partial [Ruania sp.]|nr:RNA polymerase subunit sigma-24 [Ruania sp.]
SPGEDPAAALSRAVAVGHVNGPSAGLKATEPLRTALSGTHRWHAVRAYLHEMNHEPATAATAYAEAAGLATSRAERDHLIRQAARLRHA